MPRALHLLGLGFLCCIAASGWQAPPSTVPPPASGTTTSVTTKTRKVYREEDLKRLRGGVSVVGDTRAEPDATPPDAQEKVSETPTASAEAADEKCPSRSWAAVVEAAVKRQGVELDAKYWHWRIFGDSCVYGNVSLSNVVSAIDGDHSLPNGRKVRLRTTSLTGLPSGDALIQAQRAGRVHILLWDGTPYITEKVETRGYSTGFSNFGTMVVKSGLAITELHLLNPSSHESRVFYVDKDDSKQIEAAIEIIVDGQKR